MGLAKANGHEILRKERKQEFLEAVYAAGFETKPLGEIGEMRETLQVYVPGLEGPVVEISPFYALREGRGRPRQSLTHKTEDFTIDPVNSSKSPKHSLAQRIVYMLYRDIVWTDSGRLAD